MRKSADTHDTAQQPATKRRKPAAQQPGEAAAHRPADWLQQAFKFDVVSTATAKEKLNVM